MARTSRSRPRLTGAGLPCGNRTVELANSNPRSQASRDFSRTIRMIHPSGDNLNMENWDLAGGGISKRTLFCAGGVSRKWMKDTPSAITASTAAAIHGNLPNRESGGAVTAASSMRYSASPMSRRRFFGSFSKHRDSNFRCGTQTFNASSRGLLFQAVLMMEPSENRR